MLKWAVLITGAALLGATVSLKLLMTAKAELRVEKVRAEQLDGQLSALIERNKRALEIRADSNTQRLKLREKSNTTTWGRTLVPDDVAGLLCEKASCAPQNTLPNPGD